MFFSISCTPAVGMSDTCFSSGSEITHSSFKDQSSNLRRTLLSRLPLYTFTQSHRLQYLTNLTQYTSANTMVCVLIQFRLVPD